MSLTLISSQKCFDGKHKQYTHKSTALNCTMRFAIYLPPQASEDSPVPLLYWLSGLTCTDENFMQKAGALRTASELGLAIVAADTSPRGEQVPDDPEGQYDFGLGAGFYVNATESPWQQHYQMYDYVVKELPALIEQHFPVSDQRAISGHSMGGHGALMIALRNPERYRSASAFSPISNPSQCPWGQKAFTGYLGHDKTQWQPYDSCNLLQQAQPEDHLPLLVDLGDRDDFLQEQLKPEALLSAAKRSEFPLTLRMQPGYDHSYYFIASFIEEHLRFHNKHLLNH